MRRKRFFGFLIAGGIFCFFVHERFVSNSGNEDSACAAVWDVGCAKVAILPFSSFLKTSVLTSCLGEQKAEYALIVPTKIYDRTVSRISLDGLRTLLAVLQKHDWLFVVAGSSIVLNPGENPACTLDKTQWTLQLSEKYSIFTNGSSSVSVSRSDFFGGNEKLNEVTCYSCDLLPDLFLINISVMVSKTRHGGDGVIDIEELAHVGESARLPLFLEMKGRSAYCPDVEVVNRSLSVNLSFDYTCNNLRMIWDGHFVQMPLLIGVFRLISPESVEHWLGCTWAKAAYDLNLPIHCSNWVRQFTLDSIDILQKLQVDYRLVYGLLLGAVR